jgi:hypothetical protein
VERTPKEDDAPIVAAGYEICRATDGAGCVKGERAGRGIEAFDDLKVPDGRVCGGVEAARRARAGSTTKTHRRAPWSERLAPPRWREPS